jgi:2-isopropylmalate synthase
MTREQIIQNAVAGVKRAKGYCEDVEFSPEDAARTEVDFLCEVIEKVIAAGANTVNIPDTVGYATPVHMAHVISSLVNRVPNIDQAVISIHCHNDLGLAVANSLAAVEAGAGQIECTINGIGERAGNCSLEEVVMAMRTRADYYHCDTKVNSQRLVPTSRLVAAITGLHVQRNKAIVGRNAFAHEAGIHQDGMLKEPTTYEIMRPEDVGLAKTDLVLGKHSGRAALADRANQLGYHMNDEQLRSVFNEFKTLADARKEVHDGDIAAIIEAELFGIVDEEWSLVSFDVATKTGESPSVTIVLRRGEESESATVNDGVGVIDSAFKAMKQIMGVDVDCKDVQISSTSGGHDAPVEANIEVEKNDRTARGRAVSDDLMTASITAILNSFNRVLRIETSANRNATAGRPGV